MNIKNRLTLLFTAIVAVIFTTILTAIYLISVRYSEASFYDRLHERAIIASKIFLEKDQLSKQRLFEFEQRFLETLSHEVLEIYDDNNTPTFISKSEHLNLSKEELDRIRTLKSVNFQKDNRYIAGLFYQDVQRHFVIVASAIDEVGTAKISKLRLVMIISFLIGLIITYFSGRLFAEKALSPIKEVVEQVRKITDSSLNMRVIAGHRNDEIGKLTLTFNEMLARIQEAFNAQRSFTSHASHELRTPLTAIIGELQMLLSKERTAEQYKEGIDIALKEAKLLKTIIDDLLTFTRTNLHDGETFKEELRIDEILWEIQEELLLRNKTAKLRMTFSQMPENQDLLSILGNRHLLGVALVNVIENAIKYSDNQEVSCTLEYSNFFVKIIVTDKGIGIPLSDLKHITEPFYRASNVRSYNGSGIGLALTQKIIEKHKGAMQIFSVEGKGTTISLVFPVLKNIINKTAADFT
ncbi:MAG: HAMP domain-containing protein [Cytophagales bacterium]|nr:MAG: HAMP domain-containing protein [Cytophagales bacterium]